MKNISNPINVKLSERAWVSSSEGRRGDVPSSPRVTDNFPRISQSTLSGFLIFQKNQVATPLPRFLPRGRKVVNRWRLRWGTVRLIKGLFRIVLNLLGLELFSFEHALSFCKYCTDFIYVFYALHMHWPKGTRPDLFTRTSGACAQCASGVP